MKHDATPAQQRMGKERQSHLSELVNKWILRRDKRLLVSAATVGLTVAHDLTVTVAANRRTSCQGRTTTSSSASSPACRPEPSECNARLGSAAATLTVDRCCKQRALPGAAGHPAHHAGQGDLRLRLGQAARQVLLHLLQRGGAGHPLAVLPPARRGVRGEPLPYVPHPTGDAEAHQDLQPPLPAPTSPRRHRPSTSFSTATQRVLAMRSSLLTLLGAHRRTGRSSTASFGRR